MGIGARIHRVRICTSTNDLAKKLALAGEKEGTVIIAEEQTEGRGTKGRSWYSPREKGLYLSVILYPSRAEISLLPLLAGLAVQEAIHTSSGIRVRLKWPNDLIWGGKKLGGILCESGFSGNRIHYAILGIGLNIDQGSNDFPPEIRSQATSLRLITGKAVERKALLEDLWRVLDYWYGQFLKGKGKMITRAFQENSFLSLGEEIIAEIEGKELSGIYRGIDSRGALIFESPGGKRLLFSTRIKTMKQKEV